VIVLFTFDNSMFSSPEFVFDEGFGRSVRTMRFQEIFHRIFSIE